MLKYSSLVVTCLILLTMLATLPDSDATSVAFGLVVTATLAAVAAVVGRRDLLLAVLGARVGFESDQQRRRGSFRRQQRPDEAGRPMPRAPGSVL
ncbi:DUF6412 domain-containing protein [Rhodococcoides kyotonense]|uniref:Uncharacterized protein n=1 Tax=Rhodococcoides kyotonense TaxID=398843 RepID=A0A239NE40_9NOCA|nr:DUF6412 domain-containing protein [Rhodococcus kyotonensis]SNT53141.1 hypothetical protein SAMN05421642_13719 [Rhodococcus kyotonensis]